MDAQLVTLMYFCQLNMVNAGWKVVFKAATGGSKDVYELYSSCATMNAENPLAAQLDLTVNDHYKSGDVNNWKNLNISLVRLSVYKDDKECAYYVFNGTNTDNESWMARYRLISTSYVDLMEPTTTINFFSLKGYQDYIVRSFYVNRNWGGCTVDNGWLTVYDLSSIHGCTWETKMQTQPAILYSPYTTYVNYDSHTRHDILADFLAIQSKYIVIIHHGLSTRYLNITVAPHFNYSMTYGNTSMPLSFRGRLIVYTEESNADQQGSSTAEQATAVNNCVKTTTSVDITTIGTTKELQGDETTLVSSTALQEVTTTRTKNRETTLQPDETTTMIAGTETTLQTVTTDVTTSRQQELTTTLTEDMNMTNQEATTEIINASTFMNISSFGFCLCKCKLISDPDIDMQLFNEILNSLKTIKTETRAYLRSKTSASDKRVSAQATGYIGILIMVLVFGSIVLSDCITLIKKLSFIKRKMKARNKKKTDI